MKYKNSKNRNYKNVSVIIPNECPHCKFKEIIKWGFRYNHTTKKQRWKCKSCSQLLIMRNFKSPESAEAILSLFVVYYNFIRVHQGINKTPIEQAGVNLNLGKNKWLDLIYNASQNKSI